MLAIAPMIDVTDRHFRMLIRAISPLPTLWTEMTWDRAILYNHPGEREHQEGQKNVRQRTVGSIIGFSTDEHPVVLQLGGSNPESLARAALHGATAGYDEINLNCGCPAQRRGKSRITYGARLMFEPALVAACCASMRTALADAGYAHVPVTVKCRLGVDERDSYAELHEFVTTVAAAGVTHFIVHARKAILGLDTIKNRSVPPLKHEWVLRLVADFPRLRFSLNGGVKSLEEAQLLLEQGVHGVMIGRRANADPYMFARSALVYGAQGSEQAGDRVAGDAGDAGGAGSDAAALAAAAAAIPSRREVLDRYVAYCAVAQAANWDETTPEGCARALLTPLTGLFHNTRFGPRWRQAVNRALLDRQRLLTRPVGQLVADCLDECGLTAPEAIDVLEGRPTLEPLPLPPVQPPPAPWPPPEDHKAANEATNAPGKVAGNTAASALTSKATASGATVAALQLSLTPTSAASLRCELLWLHSTPPHLALLPPTRSPPAALVPSQPADAAEEEEDAGLSECPGWSATDMDAGIDYELADDAAEEAVETPSALDSAALQPVTPDAAAVMSSLAPARIAPCSPAPPAYILAAALIAAAAATLAHAARARGATLPASVALATIGVAACTAVRPWARVGRR